MHVASVYVESIRIVTHVAFLTDGLCSEAVAAVGSQQAAMPGKSMCGVCSQRCQSLSGHFGVPGARMVWPAVCRRKTCWGTSGTYSGWQCRWHSTFRSCGLGRCSSPGSCTVPTNRQSPRQAPISHIHTHIHISICVLIYDQYFALTHVCAAISHGADINGISGVLPVACSVRSRLLAIIQHTGPLISLFAGHKVPNSSGCMGAMACDGTSSINN